MKDSGYTLKIQANDFILKIARNSFRQSMTTLD